MMIPRFEHMAVPQHSAEPWQIRLFRCTSYAPGWFSCPIGFKQGRQVPATPKRCSCNREQALKTVFPSVHEREAAHQQMDKQPRPYLPANGVSAVAQVVARWRNGSADGGECRRVHLECIAHVVESERMGEVSVQQRNHMAPRRERPTLDIHAMLLGKVRDHVARNQFADLFQCCISMSGWFVCVFHALQMEDFNGICQPFF